MCVRRESNPGPIEAAAGVTLMATMDFTTLDPHSNKPITPTPRISSSAHSRSVSLAASRSEAARASPSVGMVSRGGTVRCEDHEMPGPCSRRTRLDTGGPAWVWIAPGRHLCNGRTRCKIGRRPESESPASTTESRRRRAPRSEQSCLSSTPAYTVRVETLPLLASWAATVKLRRQGGPEHLDPEKCPRHDRCWPTKLSTGQNYAESN
ncbi:hypothetical protein JHW43_003622 [Diplocarpon mali]|nr:hypothetical protein JHW43_003622 [Diplocarpon mali]